MNSSSQLRHFFTLSAERESKHNWLQSYLHLTQRSNVEVTETMNKEQFPHIKQPLHADGSTSCLYQGKTEREALQTVPQTEAFYPKRWLDPITETSD